MTHDSTSTSAHQRTAAMRELIYAITACESPAGEMTVEAMADALLAIGFKPSKEPFECWLENIKEDYGADDHSAHFVMECLERLNSVMKDQNVGGIFHRGGLTICVVALEEDLDDHPVPARYACHVLNRHNGVPLGTVLTNASDPTADGIWEDILDLACQKPLTGQSRTIQFAELEFGPVFPHSDPDGGGKEE